MRSHSEAGCVVILTLNIVSRLLKFIHYFNVICIVSVSYAVLVHCMVLNFRSGGQKFAEIGGCRFFYFFHGPLGLD